MDFIDRLRELSARIPRQLEHIQTEEATKNALVMPFLSALGYNVFDPTEVTPELNADVGVKKGEKVDYAILRDGKPILLVECKHHSTDLGKVHASQLYRYFSVTDARFGLLTNGIAYWFYTDLEAPNKMDSKPFFEFNMLDIKDASVEELKKFSKGAFDLDNILTTASELKYTREIRRIIVEQVQEPSDEFVKFITAQVYTGRMTQPVREHFAQLTRQAFKQVVNEQINERLKTALASESTTATITESNPAHSASSSDTPTTPAAEAIVTTDEEIEAFLVVRAILREIVDVKRVVMRDVQSYCGILLDDSNRKPICRLHFNRSQKYIGMFDSHQEGAKDGPKEERIPIDDIDSIYKFAERLKATVARFEAMSGKKQRANGVAQ
jgi:predicted type IV restriction endonuclease